MEELDNLIIFCQHRANDEKKYFDEDDNNIYDRIVYFLEKVEEAQHNGERIRSICAHEANRWINEVIMKVPIWPPKIKG